MSEEGDDSNDGIRHIAKEAIPLSIAVWILLFPALVLEALHLHRYPSNRRNAKRTQYLMIALMATNTIHQLSFMFRHFSCGPCKLFTCFWGCSRALLKGVNWIFLIHRAKLAQGMEPVLSEKYFAKFLPGLVWLIVCGFLFSIIKSNTSQKWICASYEDREDLKFCIPDGGGQSKGIAAAALGLDGLITIFLMTLFIIPLYKIINADIGVMSQRQVKHRRTLTKLLIWSICLTFINQATSTLILLHYLHSSTFTILLWKIGQFDPAINIWTSWLMLSRNRKYLKRLLTWKERMERTSTTFELKEGSKERARVSSSKMQSLTDQVSLEMIAPPLTSVEVLVKS